MPHIAVIGGGISGLAAAWRLGNRGVEVTLFEAGHRTGGVIRSVRRDGFLVDEGPNTLVARHPVVEEVIEALGLEKARVWANAEASRRYIVRGGVPVALPTSPGSFVSTPLLSARGKLRLLREPFVRPSTEADEPLADFIRRRLGPEVLDYAVDPFVSGIFAGDPARLSTRYAFPTLHALEQDHGSLLQGMLHRARRSSGTTRPATRPFSFRDGMQTLPDALTHALGDAVQTNTPVLALARNADGWTVTTQHGTIREERFDAVVCTLPLHRLAALDFEAGLDVSPFADVPHPPVSVLALGFERGQIAHPLDGFGVLIPQHEPFNVLGALFSSSLFPGRAPDGHALLTCFIGGTRQPDQAALPTDDLVALALHDLHVLLGVRGAPIFVHHRLWEQAIPQAEVGYGRVLDTLDALETRHAGLRFAGSYRHGISVGEALLSGLSAADRVLG